MLVRQNFLKDFYISHQIRIKCSQSLSTVSPNLAVNVKILLSHHICIRYLQID